MPILGRWRRRGVGWNAYDTVGTTIPLGTRNAKSCGKGNGDTIHTAACRCGATFSAASMGSLERVPQLDPRNTIASGRAAL